MKRRYLVGFFLMFAVFVFAAFVFAAFVFAAFLRWSPEGLAAFFALPFGDAAGAAAFGAFAGAATVVVGRGVGRAAGMGLMLATRVSEAKRCWRASETSACQCARSWS